MRRVGRHAGLVGRAEPCEQLLADTPRELLALRGIYYRLYELQYKEQEMELSVPGTAASGFSQPLPADD